MSTSTSQSDERHLLPISDRHLDYARSVSERLKAAGLRAKLDERGESVGRKIRDAELRKIPLMLIAGDREAEQDAVSVREHRRGDLGAEPVERLIERLQEQVQTRATGL